MTIGHRENQTYPMTAEKTKSSRFLLFALLLAWPYEILADDEFLPVKLPNNPNSYQIVRKSHYVFAYDEDAEQPAWVAYELLASEVGGPYERTDNFRRDSTIQADSATLLDYRGSGFDRGHLAPAADMAFSKAAMSESFYLSNMSPQRPAFNRGIWRKLEARVRTWAAEYGRVYVVTAGVLPPNRAKRAMFERIGANNVLVPKRYYKIVYDSSRQAIIAFLLANNGSSRSLSSYAVPVDNIESLIGFDLFSQLPDALENRIEAQTGGAMWDFSVTATSRPKPKPATPQAETQGGPVKMSKSGICHAPGTSYYSRTKNFTAYNTIQECLDAGGRRPKR